MNRSSVVMRDHGWLPTVSVLDGLVDARTCAELTAAADATPWIERCVSDGLGLCVGASPRPERVSQRSTRLDDPRLALRLYLRLTDALPDRIALLERGPLRPGLDITRYDAGESPGVLTHTTLEDAWQRIPMVAMLVLEAPERGGELGFPSLSRTIDAQRGRVIVFRGDLPHELGVVQRGRQTVLHARFDFDASFDR